MRGVKVYFDKTDPFWNLQTPSATYVCTIEDIIQAMPSSVGIRTTRYDCPIVLPAAWAEMLRDGASRETIEVFYQLFKSIYADPLVNRAELSRHHAHYFRLFTHYDPHVRLRERKAHQKIVLDALQELHQSIKG